VLAAALADSAFCTNCVRLVVRPSCASACTCAGMPLQRASPMVGTVQILSLPGQPSRKLVPLARAAHLKEDAMFCGEKAEHRSMLDLQL
jgi:hypothetical protein